MPLKQTQHVQPAFTQPHTQSQHAWIMSQHALSPLVQVKHTPSLVIVQSHLHIHMLHWHIIMPFMVQHRLNIPPAIILHMFCRVAADISSSHVQVTFMPPAHFSIFIVQRGTMQSPCIIADMPGIWPCIGEPDMPIGLFVRLRSIIIALDIDTPLCQRGTATTTAIGPQVGGNRALDGNRVPLAVQSETPVAK
jgi:hypothetical protein